MSANAPAAPAKEKPKSKKMMIIIIVVVALLVVAGGAAAWLLSSYQKEAPRLCRGGSRSLTFQEVVHRRDFQS